MTFTDDDLKRLKDWLGGVGPVDWSQHDSDKVIALLARLEAAETYIGDPWSENLIKWRKAAGK